MKMLRLLLPVVIILIHSCTSTRIPVQSKQGEAYDAFLAGDYTRAIIKFDEFIAEATTNQTAQVHDSIYRDAGWAAFSLGLDDKALNYLLIVRNSPIANDKTFYALAILNRKVDNLSRELSALEYYVNRYPEGEHIEVLQERLFQAYVESRNYQGAYDIWPSITEKSSEDEVMLNQYFVVAKALDKDEILYRVAQKLLSLNPNNPDASFYLGTFYFDKAETRYQAEMQAYEKNRTHRQYAQLLQGFEILNADFRKSLEYLLKLYENDPQPRYARYIGNIYLRFDDKVKAKYYHYRAGN